MQVVTRISMGEKWGVRKSGAGGQDFISLKQAAVNKSVSRASRTVEEFKVLQFKRLEDDIG